MIASVCLNTSSEISTFLSLAHTGDHRGQVLEVAHLLDLGDLPHEIVEVELVLDDLLLQAAGLLLRRTAPGRVPRAIPRRPCPEYGRPYVPDGIPGWHPSSRRWR